MVGGVGVRSGWTANQIGLSGLMVEMVGRLITESMEMKVPDVPLRQFGHIKKLGVTEPPKQR